jgi:hypothetical protein
MNSFLGKVEESGKQEVASRQWRVVNGRNDEMAITAEHEGFHSLFQALFVEATLS